MCGKQCPDGHWQQKRGGCGREVDGGDTHTGDKITITHKTCSYQYGSHDDFRVPANGVATYYILSRRLGGNSWCNNGCNCKRWKWLLLATKQIDKAEQREVFCRETYNTWNSSTVRPFNRVILFLSINIMKLI